MLSEGTIPLSAEEQAAVDALLQGRHGSITRRDPGESGPVLVTVDGETHEVDVNG